MNLHEYQAKDLFRKYGVATPENCVVADLSEVDGALDQLATDRYVVKAQVHAGGRGKAGGVKLTNSKDEAKQAVQDLLGTNLVTFQTDANGQPVN
ncbi:MAG: ATP-grasp domain-containing protein, partial [Gammaproteobacteria bacterium]|nr:ATP-grasp domain-containing protein [Gammaproteobacteria bacterium]